ncbi:A/G-specific adenine glycosylase [Patescibacteria group bacterium]|nr:A/G-specific adenine glycosylase [Patescibacteria group bacterium]
MLSSKQLADFKETVWEHYRQHGRLFPWRDPSDSYHVLVSEVMLQQTQADRVVPYYERFIGRFPDVRSLSRARLATVLKLWQGLGYNRRAKMLHDMAKIVVRDYGGKLPETEAELVRLPGVGPYTAAALAAFASNQPAIVIETNIRSVFIYHFFGDQEGVTDAEILPLIGSTVDQENPREWYQALMDYGAWLKRQGVNPSRRSAHYTRQAPLKGSNREVRGAIIRELTREKVGKSELIQRTGMAPTRVRKALKNLITEGLVSEQEGRIQLT